MTVMGVGGLIFVLIGVPVVCLIELKICKDEEKRRMDDEKEDE